MFLSQVAIIFLTHQTFVTNLHPSELRCKLQEKLRRMQSLKKVLLIFRRRAFVRDVKLSFQLVKEPASNLFFFRPAGVASS